MTSRRNVRRAGHAYSGQHCAFSRLSGYDKNLVGADARSINGLLSMAWSWDLSSPACRHRTDLLRVLIEAFAMNYHMRSNRLNFRRVGEMVMAAQKKLIGEWVWKWLPLYGDPPLKGDKTNHFIRLLHARHKESNNPMQFFNWAIKCWAHRLSDWKIISCDMISLTLIKVKTMSFFDYALKRVEAATKTTVTCPICGHNSKHPTTKVRQEQALLCPKCKSLFIIHR